MQILGEQTWPSTAHTAVFPLAICLIIDVLALNSHGRMIFFSVSFLSTRDSLTFHLLSFSGLCDSVLGKGKNSKREAKKKNSAQSQISP
jgi:hypothetical protein